MNAPLHGADPCALASMLGVDAPERLIDFSTNTNAVKWEGSMSLDPEIFSQYPDIECRELRSVLAVQNGCSADEILVTNGSNEALYMIASLFPGKEASYDDPTYGEYRRACEAYGLREAARGCGDLRFICAPNNPTGECLSCEEIESSARSSPEQTIVVDEAYIDLLLVERRPLRRLPNVIILRSLTKIFHLCGARIGYVLADRAWITKIRSRQPSWSVNGPAQELCLRMIRDRDLAERTRAHYKAEVPRFIAALTDLGLDVMPTLTNFFLVRVRDDERAMRELMTRGIAVRHTRNFKGLDGRYIRVAARTTEEDMFFELAIASIDANVRQEIF